MNDKEIFVRNLRRFLNEKGLKQEYLANILGIKPSGVSQLLNPEIANPTLARLAIIAAKLDIKTWQLIQSEEDKSLIEKLLPSDIFTGLMRLTDEQKERIWTNLRNILSFHEGNPAPQSKKKLSG